MAPSENVAMPIEAGACAETPQAEPELGLLSDVLEAELQHIDALSENLSSTYEDSSLLYRITQHQKLAESNRHSGRMALEWLAEAVPAEAIVMLLLAADGSRQSCDRRVWLTHGKCPIEAVDLIHLTEHLHLGPLARPFVANSAATAADTWPCKDVRQVVLAPLADGDMLSGWLAAINHVEAGTPTDGSPRAGEFGTVEAGLLSFVGAILGMHGEGIDRSPEKSQIFSSIVRALTSAIDAKDRYTRGHSARVARISVRLAGELGCDEAMLNTIYLAGLLHDIGKIGIDDRVLRKPGKLSDEEYEHIKSHAEVGHRILHGLKQMDDILPVVLHHHEWWNGRGYPNRLPNKQIPLAARIVAVADSYDAMSSDRPYRKGMPEDRIDRIFREGSGRQWDPSVVAAFFAARDDIREIAFNGQNAVDEVS